MKCLENNCSKQRNRMNPSILSLLALLLVSDKCNFMFLGVLLQVWLVYLPSGVISLNHAAKYLYPSYVILRFLGVLLQVWLVYQLQNIWQMQATSLCYWKQEMF